MVIGASALLNAGSLMGGVASFQWQLNGLDLPGATNAALSIPFATWTNAGVYQVMASNHVWFCDRTTDSADGDAQPAVVRHLPRRDYGEQRWHASPRAGGVGVGPLVIFASTDLPDWAPILTNPPVIGAVEFIDPEAGNPAGRFYRAIEGAVAGSLRINIATLASPPSNRSFPLQLTGLTASGPVSIYALRILVGRHLTNPPTIGPLAAPPQASRCASMSVRRPQALAVTITTYEKHA